MGKKHMKTLTVPVSWPVKRKSSRFTLRPNPGKSFELSMPIALVFKNLLRYAKTMKEVKTILMDKEILVDGKRVKKPKQLVGLMDTVTIPISNENYRMLIKKSKKLYITEISKEEAKIKICKITGKTLLKKGQVQINLFDGRNVLVKKDEFKVGDSVILSLPDQKIKSILKFEKGAYVFMIGGSHVGEHGIIEKIDERAIIIKTKEDSFETPKSTVFVVGKSKSEIKLD
mgnify:CR=1 FL=1